VFGVVGLNFPHVLAEGAVEPDHGSGGLVWNGLNARPFADGTAFRQVRRSENVAHTLKCSAGSDSAQCSLSATCDWDQLRLRDANKGIAIVRRARHRAAESLTCSVQEGSDGHTDPGQTQRVCPWRHLSIVAAGY
jgi:hypothetical protein